jgi:hypothetical protein
METRARTLIIASLLSAACSPATPDDQNEDGVVGDGDVGDGDVGDGDVGDGDVGDGDVGDGDVGDGDVGDGDVGDGDVGDGDVGDGDGDGPPSDPDVCIIGIPATSQIPRLQNVSYDKVIRDLLGLTALESVSGGPPSELLVPDTKGSLTDIAWNSYLTAAEAIAAQAMADDPSRFMTCEPSVAGCYEDTIRAFGRKAFRRPVTDEEVTSFMRLSTVTPQGTPEEISETMLLTFLASPSFIMLPELNEVVETSPELADPYVLSSYEVATRLSMLIWGSIPDDELNAAADAGELTTKAQILAQAQRMIEDAEKTRGVLSQYHRKYADIRPLSHWGDTGHDPTLYPNYSEDSAAVLLAEMDSFFEDVAMNGGSFRDLLLSNVGFVNQTTAALYGLNPADFGPELTRVELEPAEQRPGFLTRAAFLSSFSSFSGTSPILRGAYITTRIIGATLDPPPPGAADTPIPPGEYATYREAVVNQTSGNACVGCHSTYVNPPGFVMEVYDSVGSWTTTDELYGGEINGTDDVYFSEENTKTITSPFELMTELATGPEARRVYAQEWMAFSTGRTPNSNDACFVQELDSKLSADGYTILNLLADLTQADSFRLRTVSK